MLQGAVDPSLCVPGTGGLGLLLVAVAVIAVHFRLSVSIVPQAHSAKLASVEDLQHDRVLN